jgi:hypothetical protein
LLFIELNNSELFLETVEEEEGTPNRKFSQAVRTGFFNQNQVNPNILNITTGLPPSRGLH